MQKLVFVAVSGARLSGFILVIRRSQCNWGPLGAYKMNYCIHRTRNTPPTTPDWQHAVWTAAETAEISHFLPQSSAHQPHTAARLLYDEQGLYGIFQVQDRYVRCLRTNYFDEVWKDSCVEFFAEPKPGCGYFNFEFNCGGAFLCSHILNPERVPGGFKDFTKVPWAVAQTIIVHSSMPRRVEPEITEPIVLTLRFSIPFSLFEHYVGGLGEIEGQVWRGNFFKCAEESSQPHWAAWSPVDKFDFHRPECFGTLTFT